MKKLISVATMFVVLMGCLCAFSGCGNGSKDENKKEEGNKENTITLSYTLSYNRGFKSVTGTIKVPQGYKIISSENSDEEYKPSKGKYAIIGNDKYVLELGCSGYVYYSSVAYEGKYGQTDPSFDAYKEYMSGDLRSTAEGKTVKEFKVGNRDALAYIYNKKPIIDIKYDDYNNYASIRVYVLPKEELESKAEAEDLLNDEELMKIISSIDVPENK